MVFLPICQRYMDSKHIFNSLVQYLSLTDRVLLLEARNGLLCIRLEWTQPLRVRCRYRRRHSKVYDIEDLHSESLATLSSPLSIPFWHCITVWSCFESLYNFALPLVDRLWEVKGCEYGWIGLLEMQHVRADFPLIAVNILFDIL